MRYVMKYVMIDYIFPIIFTEAMNHSEFQYRGNITSAGFFRVALQQEKLMVKCYGKSTSLRLLSSIEDEEIIRKLLQGE